MPLNFYPYTSLTGGGAGALDGQDGAALADGDAAMVITDAGVYWYHLNATSAAAENSPFRISPDVNAGNKRWHLVGTTAFIGAVVSRSSAQSIANSTDTNITFDVEERDVGGFWAGGAPTRLTIPIGVTGVIVKGAVHYASTAGGERLIKILKGGNNLSPYIMVRIPASGTSLSIGLQSISHVLTVASTEYFELGTFQTSGGALDTVSDRVWFSIKAVEFA